jgi:hypothetical protein
MELQISTAEHVLKHGLERSLPPAEHGPEAGPEDGVSFREACLKLGLGDKALRARIREGAITAWTVEGKRGLEWRVRLPGDPEGRPQAPPQGSAPVEEARPQAPPPAEEARPPGSAADPDRLTQALAEVEFLREEVKARRTAEEQLRVMLMQLERTNAELAGALCQKALPPAPEPEPPQKIRWWVRLWGTR